MTAGRDGSEGEALRAGVVGWSTVAGAVMGLLAGAALASLLYLLLQLPLLRGIDLVERARTPALATVVVVAVALGAVLGYLEGRLKLR